MIGRDVSPFTATRGTQGSSDCAPPASQQRPLHERERASERWTRERDGERLENGEQQRGCGQP